MMNIGAKTVGEMIQDPGLYNGLNKVGISASEADVIVFSIPFDGNISARAGARLAPQLIRELSFWWSPTTEDFEKFDDLKILDWGDAEGDDVYSVFKNAEEMAFQATKSGKLFTVIGGDHSITIPVIRGINRAVDEAVGVIHFDAHPDLLDQADENPLSHGAVHKRTVEMDHFKNPENMFLIGIRSAETSEMEYIQDNKINTLTARDVAELGVAECVQRVKAAMKGLNKIYLTFDIDCLDPAYAAGTGTPQFGGISSREALGLLRGIFDLPIIGYDIVEVAPPLDPAIISAYAARKLLIECWGNHFRKLGRLKKYNISSTHKRTEA